MNFLAELSSSNKKCLKSVATDDRSALNLAAINKSKDELDDESKHWDAFFKSGCGQWFDLIKKRTFSSTFCSLFPSEAKIIVDHWDGLRALKTKLVSAIQQHIAGS